MTSTIPFCQQKFIRNCLLLIAVTNKQKLNQKQSKTLYLNHIWFLRLTNTLNPALSHVPNHNNKNEYTLTKSAKEIATFIHETHN